MKNIIVFIGPSGAGKSKLAEVLKEKYAAVEFISTTTRLPREGEIDGISYHFKTEEEFMDMKKNGELIEFSSYAGNYYGLTKSAVYEALEKSNLCVVVLDKNGAFAIKKIFKDDENVSVKFIFVHAKLSTLYLRMVNRGDKVEKIAERLQNILDNDELLQGSFCDFTIFNDDDFENAESLIDYFMRKKI